jgi:chromosomal replication initiation ATPase DnaA
MQDVVASTFLGGKDFIEKIKSTYLGGIKKDRNLPSLNKILEKPEIEDIVSAVKSFFGSKPAFSRQAAIYVTHRYSGRTLGEIGRYFNIGESGVTQASRRFMRKLRADNKMLQDIKKVIEAINLSKV